MNYILKFSGGEVAVGSDSCQSCGCGSRNDTATTERAEGADSPCPTERRVTNAAGNHSNNKSTMVTTRLNIATRNQKWQQRG